jgi:hypothetical protein
MESNLSQSSTIARDTSYVRCRQSTVQVAAQVQQYYRQYSSVLCGGEWSGPSCLVDSLSTTATKRGTEAVDQQVQHTEYEYVGSSVRLESTVPAARAFFAVRLRFANMTTC